MRGFVGSRLKRHSHAISAKAKNTTSISTHSIPPVSQSSLAGKPYSVENHNNLQQLWHVLKAPSLYRELPPFVVTRLVKNLELQLLSSTVTRELKNFFFFSENVLEFIRHAQNPERLLNRT